MAKPLFLPDEYIGKNLNIDTNEYQLIERGKSKIDKLANSADGYLLDWDNNNGMMMYAILNKPSEEETKAITTGDFEIAFSEVNECGFISIRFGKMPWGDCTFEPRLYKNLDIPDYTFGNQGMGFTIILVDPSEGGLVKGIRLIGLGKEFSHKFATWINATYESKAPFSKEKHYDLISKTHFEFTPDALAENALFRWKLGAGVDSKDRKAVNRDEWNNER